MNPKKDSVLLFIVLVVLTISSSSPENIQSFPLSDSGHFDKLSKSHADWSEENFDICDSTAARPVLPPSRNEPQEMTREVYEELNSLAFPKPSGHFAMDGELDTSAVMLASNGTLRLYAALRGSQLYVATNSARSQGADMFVFVLVAPEELRDAPLGKGGRVAIWSAFLGNRCADTSASWYDASASALTNIVDERVGTVLEGVVDIELLTGISPKMVYLAVGKYKTGYRGKLLQQVPAGNKNGNIDPTEFYRFRTE
ncbi:MAG TPA: hypothetical protein DGH68_04955 [Bacteroidetes bacterium]|jgi:hypothetical protein|nr:hypothetical protein [Bacteroidota bacterium]